MSISSIDEDEPVSPAARLLQAPGFNLYIVAVMGFKTTVTNVDVLKKDIKEALLKHPRFSSVLVMNENMIQSWRSTAVDIENHVFMPDLDPNMESPDKFMEDYASSLSTTSMDLTKPLWELHVLNVKTSFANSTIIWRFHHSIGDGVSLISLLLACSRKSSDPQSLPTIPCKKQKTFNRFLTMWEFLNFIWKNILVILNTLVDCTLFAATLLFIKDTQTPIKGPTNYGVEMCPKRFVHRILSLENIKLVKNAMDVTMNDVLVGVTQGGLSLYLNRRYEKHNKNGFGNIEKKCHLPKDLRLTAAVIFNNRQSTMIIEDLATLIKKTTCKGTWGNVLGYVLVPFTIALQNDPLTYVYRAKTVLDRKKTSLESKCTFFASQLILKVFGMKLASALMSTVFSNTTLTFSNVVGPQEEITFCGYPISFIAPFVSGIPQALTMHCQSYDKILTISLAVDENVIPDPHQLCDDFVKSLENMKDAVINRGLVKYC